MSLTSEDDLPKVFISYSHDSEAHRNDVLAITNRLRADGVDCVIDQYFEDEPPSQGWPRWMLDCVEEATFVLVVCTETYERRFRGKEAEGKGKGVKWEGAVITQELYDRDGNNTKFIPLLFADANEPHIPLPLRSTTYYKPLTETGYEALHRRLTKQWRTKMPDVGGKRVWQSGSAEPITPITPKPASAPSSLLPHFAHTYPIQKNFTGRVRERRMLTEWLTSSDKPVFAFIAIGGMGKSALTWAWVQRDVLGDALPSAARDNPADAAQCRVPEDQRPVGIFWWSFYEREASFAAFVKQALVYASQGAIKLNDVPSTAEQLRALLPLLREQRLLLVLDGFERELRAYASLSAAYQGDAVIEDTRGDYRAATSPHAAWFLQAVGAQALQSRVLLTSRLLPRELDELAGCERQDLHSLDPADAVAFFRAQGVRGTRVEIEEVCQPYGYHPLSLRLLAGVILKDKRTPGEVQLAKHHAIVPELKGKEQHHILQVAYDDLDEEKRKLLSQIAAFRSPMSYEALSILDPYDSEERFDKALDELIERGLLSFDREQRLFDSHSVVQQYSYDRLTNKEEIHIQLRDYFADIPIPSERKVRNLDQLESVIELYHHTVQAGQHDRAFVLFQTRLFKLLYFRFGLYQVCIDLLGALFCNGDDISPVLSTDGDRAWTLDVIANSYGMSGQPRHSILLLERHNALHKQIISCQDESFSQKHSKENLAVGLSNQAYSLINIGKLQTAEQNLIQVIQLSREIRERNGWQLDATARHRLGSIWAYRGDFAAANKELDNSARYFRLHGSHEICLNEAERAFCALLKKNFFEALLASKSALNYWKRDAKRDYPVERDYVRVKWILGLAQIVSTSEQKALPKNLLSRAETHLAEALTRCRRINLIELEPDILLAWARLHHARGDAAQALTDAKEALSIADRCEYRLKQAEIRNFLAQLATEAAQPQEALRHAQQAYERAWCDGPPYCYKPALEEAERRLQALGAPLPKL